MEQLLTSLGSFGPLLVLVALLLPLGEEVVTIPAGILVARGAMSPVATWMCAYLGVIISDSIWFFVSRHYGTPLLHRRWFKRLAHPRRMLQAKHQIEARGAWVIVTARFLPGSRTAAIVMAGMLHMTVWKYLLTESIVAMASVTLQLTMGYLIAKGIGDQDTPATVMTIVAVVLLLALGSAALRWILAHRRRGTRAPRARAQWLRRFRRRKTKVAGVGMSAEDAE